MTEQEYWKAQFLEVGQLVQYRGDGAKVTCPDGDWTWIKLKETGEFRLVRIKDLVIESEKK